MDSLGDFDDKAGTLHVHLLLSYRVEDTTELHKGSLPARTQARMTSPITAAEPHG